MALWVSGFWAAVVDSGWWSAYLLRGGSVAVSVLPGNAACGSCAASSASMVRCCWSPQWLCSSGSIDLEVCLVRELSD